MVILMRKIYCYNFDKKEEIEKFWKRKLKKTRLTIELYFSGKIKYMEIWDRIAYTTLYHHLKELIKRGLIIEV